jgi:hypothetical protein
MTGVNPAKLGKTVPEAYSGGFTVTIKGWTLKVIPLPRQ